ncbi:MAG: aldose epimerase family protein [Mangrovibacterium sp.]
MQVTGQLFGKTADGQAVERFILSNDNRLSIKISSYGGIITAVEMPDKAGNTENIVLGFEKLENYLSKAYLGSGPYFGALIGRYANRIAKGEYSIDGISYSGAINNGENHLHGGRTGFDRRVCKAEILESADRAGVKLSYLSPDGEEGYPGNLRVSCCYTLDKENRLSLDYEAETDKPTVINLTNHSYFNLTGGHRNILDHELQLNAGEITEVRELIPTGRIIPVAGTPFDFIRRKKIGRDMESLPEGYDQNFVLGNEQGKLIEAGTLSEASSGRRVKVFTTQPGIQLYTGYWIPELMVDGKKKFGSYSGVALETQHYADSPNHANFPLTILRPGEHFRQTTIYQFGIEAEQPV